jgi:hypothetical protein
MTVTRDPAPAGEIQREPMCRIEWCPFPSSPEFHECWCGRLDVEHHHVDPRGMGGSPERRDDPDNIQCVCPPHHKAVTTEGYTDEIADGYYVVRNPKGSQLVKHPRYQPSAVLGAGGRDFDMGREGSTKGKTRKGTGGTGVQFPSAPPAPLSDDWADLSDDQLQALYEAAEQRQGVSFLVKCKAVWTFKERHEVWNESAYERFGASRRTLYAYANIWAICVTSDTHVIEQIGKLTDSKSLMQSIGRRSLDDGRVAMEAAVAHYGEFGEAPTVAALAQRLGVEQESKEVRMCICPACGQGHRAKEVSSGD